MLPISGLSHRPRPHHGNASFFSSVHIFLFVRTHPRQCCHAMCIRQLQPGGTPDGFLPVAHAPQGALGACADARATRRRSPGGKSWAPIGRGSSWSSRFGGAGRNGRKRAAAFGPDGDDAPRRSTRAPQAQAPGAAVSAGRCEHHAAGGDGGHPAEGCACATFAAEGCGDHDSVGAGVSAADQGRHQSFEAQSPGAGRALCDAAAGGTSRKPLSTCVRPRCPPHSSLWITRTLPASSATDAGAEGTGRGGRLACDGRVVQHRADGQDAGVCRIPRFAVQPVAAVALL